MAEKFTVDEWRAQGSKFAAEALRRAPNDPVVLALLAIHSELRSAASEDSEQAKAMNLLGGRMEDAATAMVNSLRYREG